jgi:iron complex transport system substrate-binding protein
MKKIFIAIVVILAIIGAIYSFTDINIGGKNTNTIKITDMRGKSIEIPKNVNSMVNLNATIDQMAYAIDKDKLKAVQPNFIDRIVILSKQDQEHLSTLPRINAFYNPMSTETIISIHPDIIGDLTKDPKIETRSDELGNAVVVAFCKDSIDEIKDSFKLMGTVLGNEKRGQDIYDFISTEMNMIKTKTDVQNKKRVYYANGKDYESPGPETIMNSSLKTAGAITYWDEYNLPSQTNSTEESVAIPIESIIEYNPDVIICKTKAIHDIMIADDRLKNVSAIKNNKIFTTHKAMIIDSIHSIAGTVWLANVIYPEIDTDDYKNFASKYYNFLYETKLTKDDKIFDLEN